MMCSEANLKRSVPKYRSSKTANIKTLVWPALGYLKSGVPGFQFSSLPQLLEKNNNNNARAEP